MAVGLRGCLLPGAQYLTQQPHYSRVGVPGSEVEHIFLSHTVQTATLQLGLILSHDSCHIPKEWGSGVREPVLEHIVDLFLPLSPLIGAFHQTSISSFRFVIH